MARRILWTLGLLNMLALAGLVRAQEPPPTPDELILHPCDTITWLPSKPHQVRFGSAVTHSGAPLELTRFSDVQKVLDISPSLKADAQGIALLDPGAKVRAK